LSSEGIKNIVEALIFASEEEITLKEIKDLLDGFKITINLKEIESSIDELNNDYETSGSAFEILKIAGGYQFATRKKFSHFLGKLTVETQKKKLSQSAIETLAIIAYKQPITRNEIEFVRGVNVDYIVNSLLERDLISIKGRADGPGRPILYGTTINFLRVLGLNALTDLPKLREINEILKNEKIEGISEADIDLFNSMSTAETETPKTNTEQIEINEKLDFGGVDIASDETNEGEENITEENITEENITEENITEENITEENNPEEFENGNDDFIDEYKTDDYEINDDDISDTENDNKIEDDEKQ